MILATILEVATALAAEIAVVQMVNNNISYSQVAHTRPKLLETFSAKGRIGSLIFNNLGKATSSKLKCR